MAITYKKCPKCNSKNIIPIIYGEPTYESYLRSKKGEVMLGGCCVVIDENDKSIMNEYYCKNCGNEYGKKDVIDSEYNKIRNIYGNIGGYFEGYTTFEIDFIKKEVFFGTSIYGDDKKLVKKIRTENVERLIEQLKEVNLLNWKKEYINKYVLDGTQWNVVIDANGRKRFKYGSNEYPVQWKKFCEIISTFIGRKFE